MGLIFIWFFLSVLFLKGVGRYCDCLRLYIRFLFVMLSSKQLDRLFNQICWATGVCNWCMQQQNSNTPMMWDVGQKCPSVCPFACNTFTLQTVCLFCCFMSQVNSYGHGGTVSSPNHTFSWASFNKQLTSTSCTYFHL